MPRSYASAVIDATADDVWAYLRDFGNAAEWLPGVETGVIEDGGPADRVGCVRRLIGPGDSVFRERLTALDDAGRAYRYEILECPLPVRDVRGRLRVSPVAGPPGGPAASAGAGRAFVEWSADFSADTADELAMGRTLELGIYATGLEALARRFG
ncbi:MULTISPECIES: SRPBCC family protein [Actinomadura]|uniref:SRPBCC family protein n=1 Tax=Actinomadura TaxID=1988 RepID=UPI0004282215|nr:MULTISPECIES: SRPBCC family protein [Actinomadura]RSN68679.1 SRPBCC family protein [Actinomadura sp. WAC 06369]